MQLSGPDHKIFKVLFWLSHRETLMIPVFKLPGKIFMRSQKII